MWPGGPQAHVEASEKELFVGPICLNAAHTWAAILRIKAPKCVCIHAVCLLAAQVSMLPCLQSNGPIGPRASHLFDIWWITQGSVIHPFQIQYHCCNVFFFF